VPPYFLIGNYASNLDMSSEYLLRTWIIFFLFILAFTIASAPSVYLSFENSIPLRNWQV